MLLDILQNSTALVQLISKWTAVVAPPSVIPKDIQSQFIRARQLAELTREAASDSFKLAEGIRRDSRELSDSNAAELSDSHERPATTTNTGAQLPSTSFCSLPLDPDVASHPAADALQPTPPSACRRKFALSIQDRTDLGKLEGTISETIRGLGKPWDGVLTADLQTKWLVLTFGDKAAIANVDLKTEAATIRQAFTLSACHYV
jgi:hypothetical protein